VTALCSDFDGSTITITLDREPPAGARLALTSIVQLAGPELVHREGSYHEFAFAGRVLADLAVGHRPRHANDGPLSAFLILPDGTTDPVHVAPMSSTTAPRTAPVIAEPLDAPELDFAGEPAYRFRGLHIDLARQWFEPSVVLRLIDACVARHLTHLHLHLTDDEAWRLPVRGYPALTEIGGTRGYGLPLGPMLGGGPAPVGRAYTEAEIGEWVARATESGVVLVPEVDLPAHNHAALTALPELRDPDDTSGAVSVQFFTDNVLVPGLPATQPFLEAVVDTLAALFPHSPHLHIGGDEVPEGAWSGSPVVARLRAEHGLATTREVEAHFHRHLVHLVRERADRRIGAWQEAAESGGVQPGDGYVVGWRRAEDCRALAAAGYDVVVAPGEAYYFDMAVDDEWDTPGMSWAGSTSLADVRAFDPTSGWSAEERSRVLGVQACLWTELVPDEATLWNRLLPRLDAFAERAWHG
jgi:hexosaminidase